MSDVVYAYLEDNAAALNVSALAYVVRGDIDLPRLKAPSTAAAYLDELEESGQIYFEHDFIDIRCIDVLGLRDASFPLIDYLIAKLIYAQKLKRPRGFRNNSAPPNYNYPLKRSSLASCPLLWIGRQIAYYKREWWAKNIWHKRYPQYNWENNLGLRCADHHRHCWQHGPIFNVHHMDYIQQLPSYWLQLLDVFDLETCLGPNHYSDKDSWWDRYMGKSRFTSSITNQHNIRRMMALANGMYSPKFRENITPDIETYIHNAYLRD